MCDISLAAFINLDSVSGVIGRLPLCAASASCARLGAICEWPNSSRMLPKAVKPLTGALPRDLVLTCQEQTPAI